MPETPLLRNASKPNFLRLIMPIHAAKHLSNNPIPDQSQGNDAIGETPGLVTKDVIARAFAVSPRCVEMWVAKRLIPIVRISPRCVRFHLPSVLAALRRLEVKEVR